MSDLQQALGIAIPVILAPMAGISGGALAAACAEAGALGLVGAGAISAERLQKEWHLAKEQLANCNADREHSALGIGLINFICTQEMLQAAIDLQPRAIWPSFGDWQPWCRVVKAAGNIKLICQVPDLQQATEAIEAGADVVVAQGSEAGGHGYRHSSSLLTLVPEMVDHVARLCAERRVPPIPVVAAGGIVDARQLVAAVLKLGAAGVAVGTRLAASLESQYSSFKKEAIVRAGSDAACCNATLRTTLYDELGNVGWERAGNIDGRCLQNDFTQDHHSDQQLSADKRQELQHELSSVGLPAQAVWAGSGVGMITSLEPAKTLLHQLVSAGCWVTPDSKEGG